MTGTIVRKRVRRAALLAVTSVIAACGPTDGPLGVEEAPTTVLGQVVSLSQTAGTSALAGIEVREEQGAASALTGANGEFRLEVRSDDGRIRLRFRKGDIDVRLELEGIPAGAAFRIAVHLSLDEATLLSAMHHDDAEFEGKARLLSTEGDAPNRTVRLEVVGEHGTIPVDLVEETTAFYHSGDAVDLDALLELLQTDAVVEIEGEGALQDDGSVLAAEVKVETDEDDDSDDDAQDDAEFEGKASLVSTDGDAPERSIHLEVLGDHGSVTVELVEGVTAFDDSGDVSDMDTLLELFQSDAVVEIEGEGTVQDDGSVLAREVKVETDDDDDGDDPDDNEGPAEFDGTAALVSVDGAAPTRTVRVELTDELGASVEVELVEGTTTFDALGDLLDVDALLAALDRADLVVRIEGEGTVQEDGSVLAREVKVETDEIG